MKKNKKLTVNKRAIRELRDKDLKRVAGGMHISTYCSSYTATCTDQCSDYNTIYN